MIRTAAFLLALALAAGSAHASERASKANAIARAAERDYSPEAYRSCDGYRSGTHQRLLCLERFERKRLATGGLSEEWSGSSATRFCQVMTDHYDRADCLSNPRSFGYTGGR